MPTITFDSNANLDAIIAGVREFLQDEVFRRHSDHAFLLNDPHAIHSGDGRYLDTVIELMREVRMASARAGYYAMFAPKSIGGEGLGFEALFRIWETIFHDCGGLHWLGKSTVAHWTEGPSPLLAHATAAVRDHVLAGLLSGRDTMCFAMSEPDAGSDAWRMRTRATRDGETWVLNGSKQWISNAAHADLAVVFAVTDRAAADAKKGGISAFLVPTETPGFRVASVIPMFGHAGSHEGIIELTGARVGSEMMLGEEGLGFDLAMQGVSLGRLYNAANGVGLGLWALERAAVYLGQRETFGRPLSDYQGLTFPFAESAMEIHAATLAGLNCARLLDRGAKARTELAISKTLAIEAGTRAIDRAVQVHGAMGFTNEMGLAVAWQQLRQVSVADGSAEILRRQVASDIIRGRATL